MNKRSKRQWLIPVTAAVLALAGVGIYAVAQPTLGGMGGHGMMGSGMMNNSGNTSTNAPSTASSESPGEQAFQQTCSTCHGAPSPSQHAASDWPSVVHRMEQRMSAYGLNVPDQKTTQAIVHYLQSHASG